MIDTLAMAPCGRHPPTPLAIQVTAGGRPALCVQCVVDERDEARAELARYKTAVTDVIQGRMLDVLHSHAPETLGVRAARLEGERDAARAALQQIADLAPECDWCDDGGGVACGEPAVARVDHTWNACERHLPRGRGTVERLLWATTARAALSDPGAVARPDTTEG